MKARAALALAAVPLVLAGCGGAGSSHVAAGHVMSDGSTMSGSSMSGMNMTGKPDQRLVRHDAAGDVAPSSTAAMVCGPEIRRAVRRTLQLPTTPVGLHAWGNRLYSCSYQLGGGDLRLSVKDLDSPRAGRAYFDRLRAGLPGAHAIGGLASYGFPSFETAHGDVVFIKDHKTLWVDATRLTAADLPPGTSREDAAYGVAAAVIACWTE